MGDPSDGPARTRRKSLVTIGLDMGVLSHSQTLPSGFETPIAPMSEELHLTPRSHDTSSHSSAPSVGTDRGTFDSLDGGPRSPSKLKMDEIRIEHRDSLDSVPLTSISDPNDGPRISLTIDVIPARETLFEPDEAAEEPETVSQSLPGNTSPLHASAAPSTISRGEHIRAPSENPSLGSRFASLPQQISYSSTTPNPRTSASPLSNAFTFFSKLFTPNPDPSNVASSSSAATPVLKKITSWIGAADSAPATPSAHSRTSIDFPVSLKAQSSATMVTTRQSSLPPKSEQEEIKHRELYLAMVQAYEAKEAEQRAKSEQRQKAKDSRIMMARGVWSREILPYWDKKKRTKPVHDLVLQGIPAFVRTKVWPLMLGNALHITPDLFKIYVKQAEAAKALRAQGAAAGLEIGKLATASLIGVDLPRTFPALAFYREGGPNHAELHRVLDAYVCYRPDIGYVQGMSYLAAILLLYLDDVTAFTCLANLLNRSVHMAFYKMDVELSQFISLFETLFRRSLPTLQAHFESIGLTSEMYLLDWFLTIYSKSLPLDLATHLWDIYIFEGPCFLFRASIGILKYLEPRILAQDLELGPCKKLLARIPEDGLDEDELLASIASVTLREHEELMTQLQVPLFQL